MTEERIEKMLQKIKPIMDAGNRDVEKVCGNCVHYNHTFESCHFYPLIDLLGCFTKACSKFRSKL